MPRMLTYDVYMLASGHFGTLYIGMTNDIFRRMFEHREGTASAFTRKYKVTRLVWFETHFDVHAAIQREKSLKRWPRAWKINLIERENPHWQDLYPPLLAQEFPEWTDNTQRNGS